MIQKLSLSIRVAAVAALFTIRLNGAIMTAPPGLNPGDPYQLIFVTSGTVSPTSTNIADYNTFVTNAANAVGALAGLGTNWTAVGSTATTSAATNIGGVSAVPIYLLTGVIIANGTVDLFDGSIATGVNRTELDSTYSGQVWTGTVSSGGIGNPLGGGPTITAGLSTASDGGWLNNAQLSSTAGQLPLYGISATLTVPNADVPEPGTVTLVIGGLLFIFHRRHAQRKSL